MYEAMKKLFFTLFVILLTLPSFCQSLSTKLARAYHVFASDSQLKNSISALYVINARTGKVVFDRNSLVGLAPASTQKIITSATAFELLGKDFRYRTSFYNTGRTVLVYGSGDPTLGSWRYAGTRDTAVFEELIKGLKNAGLTSFDELKIMADDADHISPPSWINEDVANYYGVPSFGFNWKENQYDLVFLPGSREGMPAPLDPDNKTPFDNKFQNLVTTGAAGSGDNAYIYFVPGKNLVLVKGTVPAGSRRFTISGADYSPACSFSRAFLNYAAAKNLYKGINRNNCNDSAFENHVSAVASGTPLYVHYSPALDSIIYWFNRKSINFYGEALVRTLAAGKDTLSSTSKGIQYLQEFWKTKNIATSELNMVDGSGLSPLNRVTAHAQVQVMQYARKQEWFPAYYDSFPEYNGMKMKSGTIRGAKGFCGFQKSKDGNEYIFSFLVNNYNGPASTVVLKMYKLLDLLK